MSTASNSTPLPLLPSLTALVPVSQLQSVTHRASLLASHATAYGLEQEFYAPEREAVPVPGGRVLRAQAIDGGGSGEKVFKLQVLSKPIRGRGFEETRVQSCAELQCLGVDSWDRLRDFVASLGYAFVRLPWIGSG